MRVFCFSGRALGLAGLILLMGEASTALGHEDLLVRIAALSDEIEQTQGMDPKALIRRADLYRRHQEWDKALTDLHEASKLAPEDPMICLAKAQVYLDSEEPEKVLQVLKATSSEPSDAALRAQSRRLQGRASVLLGSYDEAIVFFQQALAEETKPLPEYYVELARTACLTDRPSTEEALSVLDQGASRLGDLAIFCEEAVRLELERGGQEPALKRLQDRRRETGSLNPEWSLREGDLLVALGRREEARSVYGEALAHIRALPSSRRRAPAMDAIRVSLEQRLRQEP